MEPAVKARRVLIRDVEVTKDALIVRLEDERTISAPLGWFPRLAYGTPDERADWRLIGDGEGVHWETLDEDVSVSGVLAGLPSGEGSDSFERWKKALDSYRRGEEQLPWMIVHPLPDWCDEA